MRKIHRWPGLIISFILLYYGITGIFMNHRELFSGIDIKRNILPNAYHYRNWNNAAIKGNIIINPDSILVFGNIGIWSTDSTFEKYSSCNEGFPKGSDNRKIFDLHRTANGNLYAATLFGFYAFDNSSKKWVNLHLKEENQRFQGIESTGDSLFVLSRSFLFVGKSAGIYTTFKKMQLTSPEGFDNTVGLFQTIWQIHSGEIFGLPGKLFVDLLGIVTIFLSITGIIYFFFPQWIKRKLKKSQPATRIVKVNRWSLNWHNKIGAKAFVFLIVLFLTGIFLRPPLLIAIANARIAPVKFSHLDQPNPWYDKFRDILFDKRKKQFLLSTSEGMFYMELRDMQPRHLINQPPVSVMGINVFEPFESGSYLIGSFSGLYLWYPDNPEIINYVTGSLYHEQKGGRPVGDFKISGLITKPSGKLYMVDYDLGVQPLWHEDGFTAMPDNVIRESKISLWSTCLEIHTGRIFQGLLGMFYILLVPLCGLAGILVVFSGYMVWRKQYKKKPNL